VPAAKKNMLDLSSCFAFVLASGWMEMDSDRWSAVEGWVADCAALRRRTKMSLFAVSELSSMQPCGPTCSGEDLFLDQKKNTGKGSTPF
jgi:hypothetical protein